MLLRLSLNRIEEQLSSAVGDYQAGFRKGQQISTLKLVEHTILKKRKMVVTFEDFKKAYDSIEKQMPGKILKNIGLDGTTQELITEVLIDTNSRMRLRGALSEELEITQGDRLSPMLFNIVLDEVISQWRTTNN